MTRTTLSKSLSATMLAGLLIMISLLAAGCSHQNGSSGGGDKTPAQIQSDAQSRAAGLAAQAKQQKH